MSDDWLVRLEQVSLGYGPRVVLEDVSLEVRNGDFLALIGPNGSGKTTLLRALLGQLRPRRGSIEFSQPVRRARVSFGYVPQARAMDLAYPLTTLDVVLMGRFPQVRWCLPPGRSHRAAALAALDRVGVADLAQVQFSELSGGQQQRVLVARALATEARALLLDEPTNDMDLRSEYDLMQLLCSLHAAGGLTLVLVSHLLHNILSYAPRISILHERRLTTFDSTELTDGRHLGAIYGLPVCVVENDGHRAVLAGVPHA